MLAISLMRLGAKKRPFYRVVVKEKRSKRDGKYIENVGTYNPMSDPAEVNLKHERIQYWISVGAQPSETVASLIKNNPELSEEEKAAKTQALADKKEAEKQARLEAKRAEEEAKAEEVRKAVEAKKAEEAAAKAEEEAATKAEEEAKASAEEAATEETPAEETASEEPATEEKATEGE
jgi:small subunit ribosomal protein S16